MRPKERTPEHQTPGSLSDEGKMLMGGKLGEKRKPLYMSVSSTTSKRKKGGDIR